MLKTETYIHSTITGILLLLIFTAAGTAKSRTIHREGGHHWPSRLSSNDLRTLEQRLTPFLSERAARRGHRRPATTTQPVPRESDLLLLAKIWNRLSPQFRVLYKQATLLPDSFISYPTPGGFGEILYTTEGENRVDTTDRYGFAAADWRLKVNGPNGIPDYIDESAFAFDSCYTMEVERFGFVPPVAVHDDRYPSDRYKIVIEDQGSGYYGLTFLGEQLENNRGYSSSITLRNDWSGSEWSSLGYDVNPINGIRVTCAHELFHAIQYAMSWHVVGDIFLDDFPLSWTEGCAVTMEEVAFDSIDDYHQYATTYFSRPTMSFFDGTMSDVVYTNALVLLYLYHHSPSSSGMDFIHSMHFSNYRERIPFHDNLRQTSIAIGSTWTDLLHSFHTASFYTGSHADTARFIPDAASFTMRSELPTTLPTTVERAMRVNSVEHIRFIPEEHQVDTLTIQFSGDKEVTGGFTRTNWSVTALLRKNDTDSLVPVTVDENASASLEIRSWRSLDEATLIVTNADPTRVRNFSLWCNVDSIIPSDRIDLFPVPVSLRRHNGISYVSGNEIADIAVYSLNGSLVWRLPESTDPPAPGRQRFTLSCRNSDGTAFVPGLYTVLITRDAFSKLKPRRTRRKLLVTP